MSDPAPGRPADAVTPTEDAPLDASVASAMDGGRADQAPDEEPEAGPEAPGVSTDSLGPGAVASGIAPGVPLAGAYMPPSTVHRPPPGVPAAHMPMAASPSVGAPPPASTAGWSPPPVAAPPAPAAAPAEAGRASLFADLPFDAPDSVAEWLVAIGSGVAAFSFLLPWISGTTSYATSWGLASASRLPILAVLVVTAVLGILPNRVALWVRAGVLGLIGGSLYLGNTWPIVTGDFGDAAVGAVIGAAAAIVLVVGGILAVAPRRPTTEDS